MTNGRTYQTDRQTDRQTRKKFKADVTVKEKDKTSKTGRYR